MLKNNLIGWHYYLFNSFNFFNNNYVYDHYVRFTYARGSIFKKSNFFFFYKNKKNVATYSFRKTRLDVLFNFRKYNAYTKTLAFKLRESYMIDLASIREIRRLSPKHSFNFSTKSFFILGSLFSPYYNFIRFDSYSMINFLFDFNAIALKKKKLWRASTLFFKNLSKINFKIKNDKSFSRNFYKLLLKKKKKPLFFIKKFFINNIFFLKTFSWDAFRFLLYFYLVKIKKKKTKLRLKHKPFSPFFNKILYKQSAYRFFELLHFFKKFQKFYRILKKNKQLPAYRRNKLKLELSNYCQGPGSLIFGNKNHRPNRSSPLSNCEYITVLTKKRVRSASSVFKPLAIYYQSKTSVLAVRTTFYRYFRSSARFWNLIFRKWVFGLFFQTMSNGKVPFKLMLKTYIYYLFSTSAIENAINFFNLFFLQFYNKWFTASQNRFERTLYLKLRKLKLRKLKLRKLKLRKLKLRKLKLRKLKLRKLKLRKLKLRKLKLRKLKLRKLKLRKLKLRKLKLRKLKLRKLKLRKLKLRKLKLRKLKLRKLKLRKLKLRKLKLRKLKLRKLKLRKLKLRKLKLRKLKLRKLKLRKLKLRKLKLRKLKLRKLKLRKLKLRKLKLLLLTQFLSAIVPLQSSTVRKPRRVWRHNYRKQKFKKFKFLKHKKKLKNFLYYYKKKPQISDIAFNLRSKARLAVLRTPCCESLATILFRGTILGEFFGNSQKTIQRRQFVDFKKIRLRANFLRGVSKYKANFRLSANNFLLKSALFKLANATNTSYLINFLKRRHYSFSYKNEMKNFVIKRYFKNKIIKDLNFFYKNRHKSKNLYYFPNLNLSDTLNSITVSSRNQQNSHISHRSLLSGLTVGQNWKTNLVSTSLVKTFYLDYREAIMRRIKFKPGYSTIWRAARTLVKQELKLNFRYQHRLTRYLLKYYKFSNINFFFFSELQLINVLFKTKLLPSLAIIENYIANKLIFINGFNCLNTKLILIKYDYIQFIVHNKYYILSRWLLHTLNQKRISVKNKIYTKLNKKHNVSEGKQRSRTLPNWVNHRKIQLIDVPSYLEVDYSSLSCILLYEPFFWYDIDFQYFIQLRASIINMYNWKYIT